MSDMNCPICGGDIQYNSSYSTYDCKNNPAEHYASEDLWQELIRTRKALEYAKDELDVISLKYHKTTPSIILIKYAEHAKAKITALEQKGE